MVFLCYLQIKLLSQKRSGIFNICLCNLYNLLYSFNSFIHFVNTFGLLILFSFIIWRILVRILSMSLLMILTACSSTEQVEVKPAPPTCDIEYSTYQATVTGYCQEVMAQLPASVPVIEKQIEIRDVDTIPEVFWYNKKMKYSLVKQEGEAPLVFVIAGTGASYESAKMVNLQKTLFQQGYHVISISSPTYSNFVINATDKKDIPGYLEKDAQTLYEVMQAVLSQVEKEDEIKASSFSLTGYSLGGAHSAFISKLDEEHKKFNFEKVVLINPPVSLYNSVGVLDGYLDLKNNRAASQAMFERIFDQFAESYSEQETSSFKDGAIYSLFKDADLTEDELKMLIGVSFRMSSTDMMFAIDATYNIGGFIYKNHEISKFESITHSMYRANDITFTDYFEKVIVPWAKLQDENANREDLIQELSLKSIEPYLRNSEKIHMVTNADDIILVEGEVEYLSDVFGQRAKVFPRGGHCGNMDRKSFVEYLNTQFPGVSH